MGVNSLIVQIVDGVAPCYGCGAPCKQLLCVPCRGSLGGGPYIISDQQSAAVLRSPVAERLLAAFLSTGHHNTLTPWLGPVSKSLPTVPTILCCERSDPFLWRLSLRLCRASSHLALSTTSKRHSKQLRLVRHPLDSPEQNTLAVMTH